MTHGSWEDVRAHGSKRLLPYFTGMLMSKIVVAVVRDWRATMLESVEAGEWARKPVNTARSRGAARVLPDGRRGRPDGAQPGARRATAGDRVQRAPIPAARADQPLRPCLPAALPAA